MEEIYKTCFNLFLFFHFLGATSFLLFVPSSTVNASDNKQRDASMDKMKVTIDRSVTLPPHPSTPHLNPLTSVVCHRERDWLPALQIPYSTSRVA